MSVIDIIILIPFAYALYKGLKNGFIGQVAGILGLFLGVFLGYKFSELLSAWLSQWINANESVVKIISFAIIIIVVLVLINLLSKLIEKIFSMVMLGWLNKLLGVIVAFAFTAFIVGTVLSLILYINEAWFTIISPENIEESSLFTPLSNIAKSVFPYLKDFFRI